MYLVRKVSVFKLQMMEFVHTNVEQRFRRDSARMLLKSDLYGILFHCVLTCFGVYAIGFPGGYVCLSIATHAVGIFKVRLPSPPQATAV